MNSATYSADDDKLRLYVGRVPRDEYEALRAEGWTSTPKQDCDFVATWTPGREDTALDYAEYIGDEDQTPEDRAADRAERFAGYRDKRADEAGISADTFDAGPAVFGNQDIRRAERSARRLDRSRLCAVCQWSKAEYWQERTAAVISHAIHRQSAGVRRSRILRLESEQRKAASYLAADSRWLNHYNLRLAYERQMLQAEGGTAANAEIEPGGWFGGFQVHRVHKSTVTGLVVSVSIMADKRYYRGEPVQRADGTWGAPLALASVNIQRMAENAYRAPTDAEREAFKVATKERKAKEKATAPAKPPLINPTDADAEALQKLWNDAAFASHCARHLKSYGKDYAAEFKPSTVCRITQAAYSLNSKGNYARAETKEICGNGFVKPEAQFYNYGESSRATKLAGPVVCLVRVTSGDGSDYGPKRVIVLTDKPQKPLPAWTAPAVVEAPAELVEVQS